MENDFLKFQCQGLSQIPTRSIIGAIKDNILLDDKIGWIHEVAGEMILTWHRNGQHYLKIGLTLTRYKCY
jgi:hypothetical protein